MYERRTAIMAASGQGEGGSELEARMMHDVTVTVIDA